MAVDQAQARFDQRLREIGPERRMREHDVSYRQAFDLVWAQADRAEPMTELERARFLLRRLYPDLEGPRLDAIMARLEGEWQAGTWTGFRRPDRSPAGRPTSA